MQTPDLNILMIDADEQDVEIVRELLSVSHNFPVNLLHSPTLATGKNLLLSETPVDIILMDLCVSEAVGLETLVHMNQMFPSIPLIILSGNANEAVALKAMNKGAQDYLIKGRFTSSHLRRSIQYALERQTLLHQLDAKHRDLQFLSDQLEAANQKLEQLAVVDGLTQVSNRRRFDQVLLSEWNRLCRECQPLSLIMGDVDYFKAFNDTYGHQAGDDCLRQVAQSIAKVAKRPADCVARYGGEEFAVILPNTDLAGATQVAENILTAIRLLDVPHAGSSNSKQITLSLGVASQVPDENVAPSILIEAADRALYVAKQQGRDRIQTHQKDCSSLESRRTLELVDRLQEALKTQRTQGWGKLRIRRGAVDYPKS